MGSKAMTKQKKFGVREFFKQFPNEDACLDHIMAVRHGKTHTCRKCGVVDATFHKITDRRAYACAHCGDHLYPCVGTIFEDSRTPLQIWFYAIFLFVSTRHGVSGRELSRQLGVTVKTGWRMGKQIRELITKTQDFDQLQGHIEIDETYIGGRSREPGRGGSTKTAIIGIKERDGRMVAVATENVRRTTMRPLVLKTVKAGATISTDEYGVYKLLKSDGYTHGTVTHSKDEYARWVDGVNHHVNGVESFWRIFKSAVASTHIHVSQKYMHT
jgi:transposase-like protein